MFVRIRRKCFFYSVVFVVMFAVGVFFYNMNKTQDIENILNNKYKLNLNKNKTYIKSSKEMISFLGYNFIIKNKKTIVKLNSNTKRKIIKSLKTNKYLFNNNKIEFKTLFCSVMNYRYSFIFVNDKILKNIFAKYWD